MAIETIRHVTCPTIDFQSRIKADSADIVSLASCLGTTLYSFLVLILDKFIVTARRMRIEFSVWHNVMNLATLTRGYEESIMREKTHAIRF